MTRDYCDRCGIETTGKQSGGINCVDDADPDGNGTVTESFALCMTCYRVVKAWLKSRVKKA